MAGIAKKRLYIDTTGIFSIFLDNWTFRGMALNIYDYDLNSSLLLGLSHLDSSRFP